MMSETYPISGATKRPDLGNVGILGAYATRVGLSVGTPEAMAREAAWGALRNASLEPGDVAAVIVGNALGGSLADQANMRGQSWLGAMGLTNAPIFNVDNSCASSSSAAFLAIHLSNAFGRPVLALGVEQMCVGDVGRTVRAIEQAMPAEERDQWMLRLGPMETIAMKLNSVWAETVLQEHENDVEGIAEVAAKARKLGAANPLVSLRGAVSAADVLASPVVSAPLTRLMCSSIADGAAAVVIGDVRGADQGVRFRAAIALSGDGTVPYHDRLAMVGSRLWAASGVANPTDIDVAEIHDATAAEEVWSSEILGLVAPNEGIRAVRTGATLPNGGGVAINPSGGLVGRGHPIGATGMYQLFELWTQLNGAAGVRQVSGARLACSVNTGGIANGDMLSAHGFVLEG